MDQKSSLVCLYVRQYVIWADACFLLCKWDEQNLRAFPMKPNKFFNFSRSLWWLTQSKALLRSHMTILANFHCSNSSTIVATSFETAATVDLLGLKPNSFWLRNFSLSKKLYMFWVWELFLQFFEKKGWGYCNSSLLQEISSWKSARSCFS